MYKFFLINAKSPLQNYTIFCNYANFEGIKKKRHFTDDVRCLTLVVGTGAWVWGCYNPNTYPQGYWRLTFLGHPFGHPLGYFLEHHLGHHLGQSFAWSPKNSKVKGWRIVRAGEFVSGLMEASNFLGSWLAPLWYFRRCDQGGLGRCRRGDPYVGDWRSLHPSAWTGNDALRRGLRALTHSTRSAT